MENDQLLFTPAAVLDLLSQITELQDMDISLTETLDNKIQISLGDSNYVLDADAPANINVDPEVLDKVDVVNTEAYEDLIETNTVTEEPIEGGLVKEILKTLAIGGMVRLGTNMLQK